MRGAHALEQHVAHRFVSRQIADVTDRSPADRERWQPLGVPGCCNGLHGRIRRDVIGLTRISEQGRDGGEQHESVDRIGPGQAVEVPSPVQLRAEHMLETFGIQSRQQRVIEHHRGVDHAGDRPHGRPDLREHAGHRRLVRDVACKGADRNALRHEAGHRGGRALRCRSLTAEQRQAAHPLAHQPPCGFQTKAGQAASDDEGGPRIGGPKGRAASECDRLRHEHDLADMGRRLHQTERVRRRAEAE